MGGWREVFEHRHCIHPHHREPAAEWCEDDLEEVEPGVGGEPAQARLERTGLGRRVAVPDDLPADDACRPRGAVRLAKADRRPRLQCGEALPAGVGGEEIAGLAGKGRVDCAGNAQSPRGGGRSCGPRRDRWS